MKKADNVSYEMSITIKKSENFTDWYKQIITKGDLIRYYDVSGCYILLPNSFEIWEKIQEFLNAEFKKRNVRNCAFPLFIREKNLSKEKDHIEGFLPEVAWIAQHDDTNDDTIEENTTINVTDEKKNTHIVDRIAIRPTSECAMYNTFSNLIRSKNDLPLKLNQWANIVRWEFKDCTPFIRSREFYWSEGHTAYDCKEDALAEIDDIISLYQLTYCQLLSIPTIRGVKTRNEKFAGADITRTIECYIPVVGKAVQAATAHCLGQNFSKMFNIVYQDTDGETKFAWQNSWGITTRSIGIMLMTHGDDKGVVIPPQIASTQIVIIPIFTKHRHLDVINKSTELFDFLKSKFRVQIDLTDHNPGWKYNYWETKGVPLRIEIGPKDIDNDRVTLCRRDTFQKTEFNNSDLITEIDKVLMDIQTNLYDNAKNTLLNSIKVCENEDEFESTILDKKISFIKWCDRDECEKYIKDKYHAKSLCIPSHLDDMSGILLPKNDKCCICGNYATLNVLFGKSY